MNMNSFQQVDTVAVNNAVVIQHQGRGFDSQSDGDFSVSKFVCSPLSLWVFCGHSSFLQFPLIVQTCMFRSVEDSKLEGKKVAKWLKA